MKAVDEMAIQVLGVQRAILWCKGAAVGSNTKVLPRCDMVDGTHAAEASGNARPWPTAIMSRTMRRAGRRHTMEAGGAMAAGVRRARSLQAEETDDSGLLVAGRMAGVEEEGGRGAGVLCKEKQEDRRRGRQTLRRGRALVGERGALGGQRCWGGRRGDGSGERCSERRAR